MGLPCIKAIARRHLPLRNVNALKSSLLEEWNFLQTVFNNIIASIKTCYDMCVRVKEGHVTFRIKFTGLNSFLDYSFIFWNLLVTRHCQFCCFILHLYIICSALNFFLLQLCAMMLCMILLKFIKLKLTVSEKSVILCM